MSGRPSARATDVPVPIPEAPAVMNDALDFDDEEGVQVPRRQVFGEDDLPDELQYKESTFFWHPEGDLEGPVAILWVNTNFPNSNAMVVSELLIPRLNELNHVYILSRPRARQNPLIKITRNATGQQFHDLVDPQERLNSVVCSPPIPLRPFITGSSRYSIGKFDSDKFFDVCAQFMSGSMRVQAKEMTIRYIPG